MADSMCGPSNALQNFQKHSQADRTLQQDRLVARSSPSQGFRSSQAQNAGLLDPEFEAFQAGQAPFIHPEHQGFAGPGPSTFQQPFHPGQAGPSNWANDFQRLNISSPPPFQQQQQQQFVQQRSDVGGWHQDFARQQAQHPAQPNIHTGIISSAYQHPVGQSNYGGMGFQPFQSQLPMQQQQHQQQPQFHQEQEADVFDEEAFARAFDNAAKQDLEAEQHESIQKENTGQEVLLDESAERMMESEQPQATDRLGADLIHDPLNEQQERPQQDDADALARTAGQLLDSVRDNQSNKFQNSQFLELMRQLRDKEVMVEGDKIVTTQTGEELEQVEVQMKSLLRLLKRFALDRDRPVNLTDRDVKRNILRILVALTHLEQAGRIDQELIDRTRLVRTLQAIPQHHSIIDDQINYIYKQFGLEHGQRSLSDTRDPQEDADRTTTSEIDVTPSSDFVPSFLRTWAMSDSYDLLTQAEKEALLGYSYTKMSPEIDSSDFDEHDRRVRYILGSSTYDVLQFLAGFGFPRDTVADLIPSLHSTSIPGPIRREFLSLVCSNIIKSWPIWHGTLYTSGARLDFPNGDYPGLKQGVHATLKDFLSVNPDHIDLKTLDMLPVEEYDAQIERLLGGMQNTWNASVPALAEKVVENVAPQVRGEALRESQAPVSGEGLRQASARSEGRVQRNKMMYRMRSDEQWGRVEWIGPDEMTASA